MSVFFDNEYDESEPEQVNDRRRDVNRLAKPTVNLQISPERRRIAERMAKPNVNIPGSPRGEAGTHFYFNYYLKV